MKKKIIVIIFIVLLCITFFSGCFESDNNKKDEDNELSKFIGSWKGGIYNGNEYEDDKIWTFYSNSSLKRAANSNGDISSISWYKYEIDENGALCLRDPAISFLMCYEYEFSEDNTKFTLALDDTPMYEFEKM